MTPVDFYFGTASRYSYLAAVRIPALQKETGAVVRWRAVYSPDLIKRAGNDAFSVTKPLGQYDPAYRSRDAQRWASFLGVPYVEPDLAGFDSLPLALWSVAAALLGNGAVFGGAVLDAVFGRGAPPCSRTELEELARKAGSSAERIADLVATGAAEEAHEQNIRDALAAGAFGVPTFVTDDGELFWGQDRVPLLAHHLARRAR